MINIATLFAVFSIDMTCENIHMNTTKTTY